MEIKIIIDRTYCTKGGRYTMCTLEYKSLSDL